MPGPVRPLGRLRARTAAELPSSMQKLGPLVGTWSVNIRWSEDSHRLVGGPAEVVAKAKIDWLDRSGILHYEIGPSHWLIGQDKSDRGYTVLYSDERRVSRIYRMSFGRGLWRVWRDAPGFRQRFEGRLRGNGRRIEAFWDKAEGGGPWARDFDMTFALLNRRVEARLESVEYSDGGPGRRSGPCLPHHRREPLHDHRQRGSSGSTVGITCILRPLGVRGLLLDFES
jgi:hypothetical protein